MSVGAVATDPIERLTRLGAHALVRHAAALLAVGGMAAFLELSVLGLDHGTHLLVVLTLVIAIALLLGPGPATTGFAAGGGLAGAVSIMTVHDVLGTPHAYVQLLTYLLAGSAFILLVSAAVRYRRQASARAAEASASGEATRMATGTATMTVATPRGPGPIESLTARELEVLRLSATGIPGGEIAGLLFVSPNTVKTHLTHIYAKFGVRGRPEAISAALRCGCLTSDDICPCRRVDRTDKSPVPMTTAQLAAATID